MGTSPLESRPLDSAERSGVTPFEVHRRYDQIWDGAGPQGPYMLLFLETRVKASFYPSPTAHTHTWSPALAFHPASSIYCHSTDSVLGKAVHSLSRLGDELYLEPLDDGSFLSIFRSLAMLEKTVEKCCISLNDRSSCLVVQLHCKYGVRKTHNLSFQDCESLQAVFNPASCPHVLRAPARILGEAVLPFPPALAEVTLGIGRGRRVILRSYQEEEADSTTKAMMTEMSIGEEDFQQLQAPEGVAITFCLKEFRGLLSFAESANLPLSIHFGAPGRPAIFTIEDSVLDGHFVLATLLELDAHSQDLSSSEPHRPVPQLQDHSTLHQDNFASDDIDSYMIAMETTVGSEGSRALPSVSLTPGPQHHCGPGPESEEEDEAEPSPVPGTPPPKKFRSLFFGSILAPIHSPQGPSPVLAEDSDGEG
ncbi:PREDICTED: cell cycle checkpoint control protein RAD9A isoform X2 [Chinchilla lanigera]|uniref:cell cycle checkpoint control protein RAD9A isoform X2 n=1 Tax=Chinchilla lanigera TaxID=34839 RepID=UPI000695FB7B|nr:PREDICTED: cell cycle checkpoint control protein RAD9A isoform X2 [Chinchilla lanigera]